MGTLLCGGIRVGVIRGFTNTNRHQNVYSSYYSVLEYLMSKTIYFTTVQRLRFSSRRTDTFR